MTEQTDSAVTAAELDAIKQYALDQYGRLVMQNSNLRADNAKKDAAHGEVQRLRAKLHQVYRYNLLRDYPSLSKASAEEMADHIEALMFEEPVDEAVLAPAAQGGYSPEQWTEYQRQHTAANPLNVARPAPAPSAGETVLIEQVFAEFEKRTKAVPLGHENVSRGASTYNWRQSILAELRDLAAAPTTGETVRTAEEQADDALAAYEAKDRREHAPAPSAGETVLVPREPTPEMHEAAHAASLGAGEPMGPDFPWINAKIYRAMLAAAPTTGETRAAIIEECAKVVEEMIDEIYNFADAAERLRALAAAPTTGETT